MNSEERRAWRVWLLLSGGRSLLFSMAFTASMIYRITVVGMSPLELVLVGTAMELAAFVFEIPTGVVADVYSRRLSILIGSVTIGLAFLLEGLVPLFGAVLLSQVIWGLGYTFTSGASEAWISDEIGEEAAAQAFVRGAQLGTVGGLLGIVVGIALASVQLNLPIVLGGALMIALAALLALWMPERGFKPLQREERSSWSAMATTLRAGIALLRQRPVLRSFCWWNSSAASTVKASTVCGRSTSSRASPCQPCAASSCSQWCGSASLIWGAGSAPSGLRNY